MHLHFIRPWWLLLLIPAVWLVWKLWHYAINNNPWQKICDPHLLPALLVNRVTGKTHLPIILIALAWLFAILGLAGPSWTQTAQPVYRASSGNVVVMDMSPAMLATDIKPNRFIRAKYKLLDLLNDSRVGSLGLVVFSGEAYSVAPLTNDNNTLINLANTLDPSIMPVSGDNMGSGLQLANQLLQQAQAKPAFITLITTSTPSAKALEIARTIAKQGVIINVLGIGTAQGAPVALPQGGFVSDAQGHTLMNKLDQAALENLAAMGNGHYVNFTDTDTDVKQLIALTAQHTGEAQRSQQQIKRWDDSGYWFILLVLLCAVWVFRRGWWEEI